MANKLKVAYTWINVWEKVIYENYFYTEIKLNVQIRIHHLYWLKNTAIYTIYTSWV